MSVASQFFPSSGGAGGSATEIPVEILGMGGGGGQGSPTPYGTGGCGGAGGLFHSTNYSIEPGVTVPITIGLGGSPSACPNGAGGQGGATSFNYPKLPISVVGGGGGSKSNNGCSACPGGGGGGGASYPPSFNHNTNAGCGCYYRQLNCTTTLSFTVTSPAYCGKAQDTVVLRTTAEHETHPWGIKAGYPGLPGTRTPTSPYAYSAGRSGCTGGNLERVCMTYVGGPTGIGICCCLLTICSQNYQSSIAGDSSCYGGPTSFGRSTAAGGLIIKWATVHGAAPSYPGATDISPQTPGYYTYCFTSSGSITLP